MLFVAPGPFLDSALGCCGVADDLDLSDPPLPLLPRPRVAMCGGRSEVCASIGSPSTTSARLGGSSAPWGPLRGGGAEALAEHRRREGGWEGVWHSGQVMAHAKSMSENAIKVMRAGGLGSLWGC